MKVQSGLRVDKVVLERFKLLCRREKLGVGEAVERLMEICLRAGSAVSVLASRVEMTEVERKAVELRLRGALAQLRRFINKVKKGEPWVYIGQNEVHIEQAIYQPAYETALASLSKIQDAKLLEEAEHILEKANSCIEKI